MPRGHWKQRGSKSRSDSERHFRRRLAERYGISVSSDEYRQLCGDVQNGRGRLLFRESNTRTHWLVRVNGHTVRAVYDKTVNGLATALPIETAARDGEGSAQGTEARRAETENTGSVHDGPVAKPDAQPLPKDIS